MGTHLDVSHIAATPIGRRVVATARLTAVDGRQLSFDVEAHDEEELIGKDTHRRVIVTAERFMERVREKANR